MKSIYKPILSLLFIFSFSLHSFTQVTTAEIRGILSDSTTHKIDQVQLIAIHIPTGTIYSAVSFEDGTFVFPNLRTGGPYLVELKQASGKTQQLNDIFLGLDEVKIINFEVNTLQELQDVQVVAKRTNADNKKGGTGKTIDKQTIENLPSLNRSLSDVTKLTPQSAGNSFGGSNYRFNNLNIDGTGANDAFGFQEAASGAGGSTASGTPGS